MGVIDGQQVNAEVTNAAFLDANANDVGIGVIGLANELPESGNAVNNLQREHNATASYLGVNTNQPKDHKPTYLNNEGFAVNQEITPRLDQVSGKFHSTTGHGHSGIAGDGPQIQSENVANVRLHGFLNHATDLPSVTGASVDVSTEFAGKTPSISDSVKGIVVNAPYNIIPLYDQSGSLLTKLDNPDLGHTIYGRLTEATGVWTLSFYYQDDAGVETSCSLTSQFVKWYFQELLNPIVDAPVYSDQLIVPSSNLTADVVDATTTQRGLVNTGSQSFGGQKTFEGGLKVDTISEHTYDLGVTIENVNLNNGLVDGRDIAADATANDAHIADTNNPHAVTKSQVGLGNVDNTSDLNKPISTATQNALNLKANQTDLSNHIADTNNPHVVTKAQVGLGNVTNDAQLKRDAGDFSTFADKTTTIGNDIVLIEDSADSFNKKKVKLSDLGVGGGSGAGSKNYFPTVIYDATATTGWVAYKNTTPGPLPEVSPGGTPSGNLILNVSSVDPLSGASSFVLSKNANNCQGEGYYYNIPLIDLADRGHSARLLMSYLTSANFVTNDAIVYFLDSNGGLFGGVPYQIAKTLSPEKFLSKMNFAANSSTLRVYIHVATTNASAWDLKFDELILGPQEMIYGTVRPAVGTIISHASINPPAGFLYCDGAAVSRTTYYKLFNSIGTTYGAGDGVSTFNIPNFKGIFLRGAGSQTIGAETYSATLGQKQNDATAPNGLSAYGGEHQNTFNTYAFGTNTGGWGVYTPVPSGNFPWGLGPTPVSTDNGGAHGHGFNGDSETRPANAAVAYHICYDEGTYPISTDVQFSDDVGSIQAFAINPVNPPSGYLYADGSVVLKSNYPELFNRIGTQFNTGGETAAEFRLPDLRGIFVRGAGSQTIGGETYSGTFGQKQTDATAKNGLYDAGHAHGTQQYFTTQGASSWLTSGGTAHVGSGTYTDWANIQSNDPETRPANIALSYFIKYVKGTIPQFVWEQFNSIDVPEYASPSTNYMMNWSISLVHEIQIISDLTISFTSYVDGQTLNLIVKNNDSVDHTLTFPTLIKQAGFIPIVKTGKTNIYTFIRTASGFYAGGLEELS